MEAGIYTLDDFALAVKTVLLRVDINSPIDREPSDWSTTIASRRVRRPSRSWRTRRAGGDARPSG